MIRIKDGFNGERTIVVPQLIVKIMETDPLTSTLHITDIGYYPKAYHHFRERKKPINQFVLIYCTDGSGWFKIDNKEYTVSANQYFILPPGKPHAYAAHVNNPWTIYWVHFKGSLAEQYSQEHPCPTTIQTEVHSRISNRIALFEELFNTLKAGYSNENLHYASSLFHYYLGSLKYIQQYRNAGKQTPDDSNVTNLAIHYMKENIEKRINLKELSEHLGYSASHFSMLFKKQTGHSPLSYFNLLKIQQACFILDSTDMKINQISYKLGVEDTFYFSRLFHKIMGISPKEYRKVKKG